MLLDDTHPESTACRQLVVHVHTDWLAAGMAWA
jgi:hypothetical protein